MGTLGRGLLAGAVGTTLLNAATYLDMALTGRPASSTPARTVRTAADAAGLSLPDDDAHLDAYGALGGIATGIGIGVVASAARTAGLRLPAPLGAAAIGGLAMAATDGSMAAAGISDPRTWTAADWARDVVPHLAYGAGVRWAMDRADRADHDRRHVATIATTPGTGRRTASRLSLATRAALLGVAAGSRNSLAVGGPLAAGGGTAATLLSAALVSTELVADKTPGVPSRLDAGPLLGRLAGGALGAAALVRGRFSADAPTALVAALAGGAGAWAGSIAGAAWREVAAQQGWTWQAALVEDAVALGLTARAVR